MSDIRHLPLSPLDYHVLVALSEKDLYGYAIKKAVEVDSGGALTPEIGSLYRVLARLQDQGLLTEATAPEDAPDTGRGRPRRYYQTTRQGLRVLQAETERVGQVVDRARALFLNCSHP